MLAASRIVNCCKTVMPFAIWATYALQLGVTGYHLFQVYQRYRAQAERDARNGVSRAVEDTIALVIKPLRHRAVDDDRNADVEITQRLQQNEQTFDPATDNNEEGLSSVSENKENSIHLAGTSRIEDSSDEVFVVYDSRCEDFVDNHEKNDDLVSFATSTSLESTDSNRGIVKDMYSECFVCATSLDNPNKPVATLPFCMHPFHKSCLDGVLKWHQKCPVCDFHIFSPI